jgi:DNA-binding CsgD family transcriptional regulator/tetratricopeptide (TPR) repeat protein
VFVGGEAGVGKTSLVRAFTAEVNARVLSGACESLTTPTPLGPFVDVAAEVGGAFAARVDDGGEPRHVAIALLEELRRSPLLVLEDVHWADQATLDVLRVLGRRIDSTDALVLATYREDEVQDEHPLRLVLGELASAAGVSRLSVPPLSAAAVRQLAEPLAADADALYRLTRGNAFFVTEVLAAGGSELPPTVRDAVLARAARLSPSARALLDVVALVPARTELWLLGDADGLDECIASGVLVAEADAVAFRHELARLAVESAVPPRRRRELHAELLRALEARDSDPARLAHHAEEAGDAEAVLRYGPDAARRAVAAGAYREAAAQYERALRHADHLQPSERATLLAAHALTAHAVGLYVESIESRQEAIAISRELGDRVAEGDNLSRLTMPFIALGRNDEAEEASRRSIELLERGDETPELAIAYGMQAYMRMLARDNAEGVEWGRRALAVAERFGDRETMSQALNMIGTSHVMAGEIERGIRELERSLAVAAEAQSEVRTASAYGMLGSGLGEMYELERSERFLRTHIAFAEERELSSLYSRSWLACVHVYRGRWDEGTAVAREVLLGDAISGITARIALGRVRARRGDPLVWEILDEALELSLPGRHLQRLGHVHAARAEAAWLAGDRERAVEEALVVYPLALEKRHLWFAGELAYWQWKAGAPDAWPDWIAPPYRLQLEGDARAAAAAWHDHGCPYEAARALAESDEAEAQLEALAELERLGAGPLAKQVRQGLRARGATVPRGPRASTRANPAELTTRELDVLRLVADGKRNAEVADELVLSRRTVDHHVSAILRKLQVKTRGEAAAEAARLGLLQDR